MLWYVAAIENQRFKSIRDLCCTSDTSVIVDCLSAVKMEFGMKMEFHCHTQSHTHTHNTWLVPLQRLRDSVTLISTFVYCISVNSFKKRLNDYYQDMGLL